MIYKCQNCGGTNFKQQGETLTCNICSTTYNRSVLVEILNKNQKSVDEFKQRNDQLIFHEDITIQELIKKIDSLKSDNEHLQETLKEELASLKEVKECAESYQNKEFSIEEIINNAKDDVQIGVAAWLIRSLIEERLVYVYKLKHNGDFYASEEEFDELVENYKNAGGHDKIKKEFIYESKFENGKRISEKTPNVKLGVALRFYSVLKNAKIADLLHKEWKKTNSFIHRTPKNKEEVARNYNSMEEKINAFKDCFQLFKKYNLLKQSQA